MSYLTNKCFCLVSGLLVRDMRFGRYSHILVTERVRAVSFRTPGGVFADGEMRYLERFWYRCSSRPQ